MKCWKDFLAINSTEIWTFVINWTSSELFKKKKKSATPFLYFKNSEKGVTPFEKGWFAAMQYRHDVQIEKIT